MTLTTVFTTELAGIIEMAQHNGSTAGDLMKFLTEAIIDLAGAEGSFEHMQSEIKAVRRNALAGVDAVRSVLPIPTAVDVIGLANALLVAIKH